MARLLEDRRVDEPLNVFGGAKSGRFDHRLHPTACGDQAAGCVVVLAVEVGAQDAAVGRAPEAGQRSGGRCARAGVRSVRAGVRLAAGRRARLRRRLLGGVAARNRALLIRWSKKDENHLALLQLASGLIAFKKAHATRRALTQPG